MYEYKINTKCVMFRSRQYAAIQNSLVGERRAFAGAENNKSSLHVSSTFSPLPEKNIYCADLCFNLSKSFKVPIKKMDFPIRF